MKRVQNGGRGMTYIREINHKSLHDGGHCWRILGGGVIGAGLLGGVSWGGGGDGNICQLFPPKRPDMVSCGDNLCVLTTVQGNEKRFVKALDTHLA